MATRIEVAAHLDLSERHVYTLIREGVLPGSKGHGGLDPDACRLAYIRHLRGVASGQVQGTPEGLDLTKQKAMLVAEQLRELKRENDIADGLVAPFAVLTEALASVGQQIVAHLEALPLEMKRANPQLSGYDIQVVKKIVARCCEVIASTQIDCQENR